MEGLLQSQVGKKEFDFIDRIRRKKSHRRGTRGGGRMIPVKVGKEGDILRRGGES